MSTTTTGIRGISLVIVPTIDQDRAVEFYESIGFEKRTDVPMGDSYRWVEVYPEPPLRLRGGSEHRAQCSA